VLCAVQQRCSTQCRPKGAEPVRHLDRDAVTVGGLGARVQTQQRPRREQFTRTCRPAALRSTVCANTLAVPHCAFVSVWALLGRGWSTADAHAFGTAEAAQQGHLRDLVCLLGCMVHRCCKTVALHSALGCLLRGFGRVLRATDGRETDGIKSGYPRVGTECFQGLRTVQQCALCMGVDAPCSYPAAMLQQAYCMLMTI
jgi:hypothetical protein